MKQFFTITVFLFLAVLVHAKNIGGNIEVQAYIDKNCNKLPDRNELLSGNYSVTASNGKGYSNTITATSSFVNFSNVPIDNYTITSNYFYTFLSGISKQLVATKTVSVINTNTVVVTLLFDGCEITPPSTKGKLNMITYLDKNCNQLADNNELLNETHNIRIDGIGYGKTIYARAANNAVDNVNFGTYAIKATYDYYDENRKKTELSTTANVVLANENGATAILLLNPCNIKKDTIPKEPVIPKDVCGKWLNAQIVTSTMNKVSGNNLLNYTKEPLYVGLLNTKISFDGSYKWYWEKYNGDCKITGLLILPDGKKINWTNDFEHLIRLPGMYVVNYEVKCQDKICESGSKSIICNDVIVCNCGTTNEVINVYVGKGKGREQKNVKNGDSIIINKEERITIDYKVNCEGNVCDGSVNYQIINLAGAVVKQGYITKSDFNNLNGNYYLKVIANCGTKNCTTLSFPIRVYGENKKLLVDARFRWGNQIGLHLGKPLFDNFNNSKYYIGGMFGLIADVPLGNNSRWHIWPALNLSTAKYAGQQTLGTNSVNINIKHLMFRVGGDLSYAFPLNNKGSNLHLYGGLSFDGGLYSKQSYTSTPVSYVNTWIANNKSDSAQKLSTNLNLGILYDINRTFTLGLNYYRYNIVPNKNIYPALTDRGVTLRLAWFYNNKRN
jgi:hypothetical protein